MVNTIWKEALLIMCSCLKENARNTERFPLSLRITDNYALMTLCCSPHNICNDEGKFNGMRPNRAVYIDPQEVEMTYGELASKFREAEQTGKEHLTGYIVFSSDSFDKPYSEEARTYVVSSNNKAFQPNMGGYSIYGSSLDGSDLMVRLERYMASEKGGKDGWKIERCYMKGTEKEMIDLICGDFFICYAPIDSEKFLSLPDDLARKYKDMFKYPERFFQTENGIKAVPFKPIQRDNER